MISFVLGMLAAAASGPLAYYATLWWLPYREMRKTEALIRARGGGPNRWVHGNPPTHERQPVVRTCPDLVYSSCVFDLRAGGLRISAPIPDTYWSISFYGSNTDNFFVLHDRQLPDRSVDLVLLKQGMAPPSGRAGCSIVEAPSWHGIVLIRMFLRDQATLAEIRTAQRATTCVSCQRRSV